jgi:thiamine transport system permease protein
LILLTANVLPHAALDRFLNGYLAPSATITGFALLLLPGEEDWTDFLKLMTALTLISYPLLYRWIVHSAFANVRAQVITARALGAGWGMIVNELVMPQAAPQVLRACGLAALWAAGDFAISGIVAGQLNTLPLLMEDLMGNYRIEAAQLLMLPLAVIGLSLYALFVGVGRYVRG